MLADVGYLPRHAALVAGWRRSAACCPACPTPGGTSGPTRWSPAADRKSTRLNSSHLVISYAVFCLNNKRVPGSGCAAIGGENRWHAVLGTSENCIAAHASDLAVALVALDAAIDVRGAGRQRTGPLI